MGSAQPFPDSLLPLNAVSDCISCAANASVVYRLKKVCNTWRELSVSIPSVHINGRCSAGTYLLQRYMKCKLTFLHMEHYIYSIYIYIYIYIYFFYSSFYLFSTSKPYFIKHLIRICIHFFLFFFWIRDAHVFKFWLMPINIALLWLIISRLKNSLPFNKLKINKKIKLLKMYL